VNGVGLEIRDNYSSMLEKNSPDSSWLMFYHLRADALPYLIDVSRKPNNKNMEGRRLPTLHSPRAAVLQFLQQRLVHGRGVTSPGVKSEKQ
jgi:hypothetical protein